MIDKITQYRKAIAAVLVPALITLAQALADGVVTPEEWIWVAIAALGTGAVVGAVPNTLTNHQLDHVYGEHEEKSDF
jgi:hypothetical protein